MQWRSMAGWLEYEGRQVYSGIREGHHRPQAARRRSGRARSGSGRCSPRVDSVAVQGYGPDGVIHYWNKAPSGCTATTAEEAQDALFLISSFLRKRARSWRAPSRRWRKADCRFPHRRRLFCGRTEVRVTVYARPMPW